MLRVTITAVLCAATLLASLPTSADQTTKTRAQVSAELKELVNVGYQPGSDRTQYPRALQAAQRRLHDQRALVVPNPGDSNDATHSARSQPTVKSNNQ
ncbi:DUF4148 domain-containing protein [Paraburkholderia sp. RL18-101-BIB-B]|uniref:DUF4148 domain-containing protein n=1 Tax=Paraburkholderia sp. RL18-101-BIB-B TaxID=3031634 RepID=UPI0038BCF0B2